MCYTDKKVIMLLTNAFDPDPRVYQEAKSLVSAGSEVRIICWDRDLKKPPFEQIDGISIERIFVRSTHGRGITQIFFLPLFWLKASFRIIFTKFDIIHTHDFDTLLLGFILAKLRNKSIIYDAHESYIDMLYGSLPKWFLRLLWHIENILIKRVNLLITVGSILEKEFQRRGARKTCVVGNWKNLEDFIFSSEATTKTKKEFKIPEQKLVISYIGHFSKERKIKGLIAATSLSNNVHLILGGYSPTHYEIGEALKNTQHITYLGYIPPSKVPLYTAISDVVVACIYDANNPHARFSATNKLFEALAAGKAIISGNFGEIGKIIKEENCGVILEVMETENFLKAFNFFNCDGILKKYQENALKAAKEKYNWENAEKLLLKNYENV